ncbi:5821_t:CDS:2, partial [Ambispora gerdemannii]
CCVAEFDVVVSPKRVKSFKWTVNIEHAILEGLKKSIRVIYQTPALENDGVVFNLVSDSGKYSPRNDQDLCEILQLLVSKTASKWTFPKICQLYGLSETDDPSLSVFPSFICECKSLKDEYSQAVLEHLIAELKARLKTIPISGNEASKSQYVCLYLIAGPNGHGPVDFALDLLRTARTAGVTEVKDEDFFKGIAQNAVQLESALTNRKRKASEMDEEGVFVGKVFGIVTDAKEWYFLECSLDDQERPRFKLSKPLVVVYENEDMEAMVERVLGHIGRGTKTRGIRGWK